MTEHDQSEARALTPGIEQLSSESDTEAVFDRAVKPCDGGNRFKNNKLRQTEMVPGNRGMICSRRAGICLTSLWALGRTKVGWGSGVLLMGCVLLVSWVAWSDKLGLTWADFEANAPKGMGTLALLTALIFLVWFWAAIRCEGDRDQWPWHRGRLEDPERFSDIERIWGRRGVVALMCLILLIGFGAVLLWLAESVISGQPNHR